MRKQMMIKKISIDFDTLKILNISAEIKPHKHAFCLSNCEFSTRFIPGDQCSSLMFKVKDNYESIKSVDEHKFIYIKFSKSFQAYTVTIGIYKDKKLFKVYAKSVPG